MPWWVFNAAVAWKILKQMMKEDEQMKSLFDKLQGLKTYLAGAAVAICGAIEAVHTAGYISWTVPEWVYAVLIGAGIMAGRAAIKKLEP